ncbi:MAG: DUF4010 domain-containing protein [Xanthobacteraceae bacterium]|nr:MAG: DUF4010 domain-containing protein [Xanthobacteraceae bacterium]
MDFLELISRFGLALGIGLLFGLERGWRSREEPSGTRAAGIRTFAISGLLGGVIGAIGQAFSGVGGGVLIGLSFMAYGGGAAAFCLQENRSQKTYSATTWVAAILTFALGMYSVLGDMRAAAGLAVTATLLLALREPLHGWIEKLTWPELRSALVLLAMTFIALPIMPEGQIGPLGGINPREIWIIAIVLAGASFVGYAAVKYFGATHGILLAGAAGGLASSTAVTISNARHAASGEGSIRLLAAGVAIASTVMFLRVLAIVLAINPLLLPYLAPPLLAAAIVGLAYALAATYLHRGAESNPPQLKFRSPLAFWPVMGFALFLGLVIVASRLISNQLGSNWTIAGAAAVGLVDVDAMTVSLARMAPQSLAERDAIIAILAAVAADTISKIAIGAVIGRGRFAMSITTMAVGCLAAGAAAFWATMTIVGWS